MKKSNSKNITCILLLVSMFGNIVSIYRQDDGEVERLKSLNHSEEWKQIIYQDFKTKPQSENICYQQISYCDLSKFERKIDIDVSTLLTGFDKTLEVVKKLGELIDHLYKNRILKFRHEKRRLIRMLFKKNKFERSSKMTRKMFIEKNNESQGSIIKQLRNLRSVRNLPEHEISSLGQIFYEGIDKDVELLINLDKNPKMIVKQLAEIYKTSGLDNKNNLQSVKNNFAKCIDTQQEFVSHRVCHECYRSPGYDGLNYNEFEIITVGCQNFKNDLVNIVSAFTEDFDQNQSKNGDKNGDNGNSGSNLSPGTNNFVQGRFLDGIDLQVTPSVPKLTHRETLRLFFTLYMEINENFKNLEMFQIYTDIKDNCIIKIESNYKDKDEKPMNYNLNTCQKHGIGNGGASSHSNSMRIFPIDSQYLQVIKQYESYMERNGIKGESGTVSTAGGDQAEHFLGHDLEFSSSNSLAEGFHPGESSFNLNEDF